MLVRHSRLVVIAAFLLGIGFDALGLGAIRHDSSGVVHAQSAGAAAACNNALFDGAYGIKLEGEALAAPGGAPLPSPVPIDVVGATIADGAGNTRGVETVDANGTTGQDTGSGTYTVNPNCTFTLTSTITLASGKVATFHLVGVLVDGGKKAYVIDDDSGLANLEATLERQ